MMRCRFVALILLVASLTLAAQDAQAQFQLRLEQTGFASKTVTDNGPDDSSPVLGRITYMGAYGTFAVTVNTGLSKPSIGNGTTHADMDLNSSDFSTTTGGTLQITLVDTGFAFPSNNSGNLMTLTSSVGGTFGGLAGDAPAGTSVTFRAWANPTDASPLATDPTTIPAGSVGVAPMGPFFSSPYSQNGAPVNFTKGAGPYSIFNQAIIYLPGSGRVGFDQFTRVEGQNCTGKLGDYVWNDLNRNGIQESGEPGIPGITVTLMKNGNPAATTTTDGNGLYQFTGLCAATYTVEVPPQAGLTGYVASPTQQGGDAAADSNPNPFTVVFITDNEDDQTIDFGYFLPAPHLTLVKTPKNGTFNQGQPISFSFVVGNDGGSPATNVTLTDQLPGNGNLQWQLAAGNPSQGSCTISQTNLLSCNFGTIQKAGSVTVTVTSGTSTPMAACQAQLNPIATAAADGGLSATDSGDWNCVPPQLTIVKTPDGGTFNVGQQVSFTIKVSNPAPAGASPASNVTLTDTLPTNGNLVWQSATTSQGTCTLSSNNLSCALGSIAAGASVTVTVNSTATTPEAACQMQQNPVARATDASGLDVQDSGSLNCTYIASTTLVTKTVSPGTTVAVGTPVTITVTETNTGNTTITNVNVTGTGCTAWTPASVGSLAAGASADFSCTFTPATTTNWAATGHGTDILGNAVSEANETTSGTVTVIHPATVLTTKSVSPSTIVKPGTSVTIKVKELNNGDSTITNVYVTGTGCTTWTPASVASLAPGAYAEFSCTFSPTTTTNWSATGHGKDVLNNPVPYTNETTSGTITVDGTKPVCSVYATANPPYMTFADAQTGIVRLNVTTNLNTNYKVKVTPTPAGTVFSPAVPYQPYPMPTGQVITFPSPVFGTITTTAYKINAVSSQLTVLATDAAGNQISCDPIETTITRLKQDSGVQTFYNVPRQEHIVTIENGGLKSVEIDVNGTVFKVKRLSDDEVRVVDIKSAMNPGNNNTITLIPKGKKGESADVTIGPPED